MDFAEAEQQRLQLSGRLSDGQITRDQYTDAISALRVTDPQGRWWQPDPEGPGWLAWDGSAWKPATPPLSTGGLQPGTPRKLVEFQSRMMTVDEFKKMSREVPLSKRPQKWWDLASILGGIVAACLWLLYSGNPWGEGIDFITAVLMAGLPIFMIWFREDLDVILLQVQQYRKNINKLLLVGIGMAFPFLTSFILFNFLDIRENALVQYNMIIGAFGAYIITRNPVIHMPGTGSHQGSGKPPSTAMYGILVVLAMILIRFLVLPVRADDCWRVPWDEQDCARTPGVAEILAGTPPAVIAGLANGKGIHDTISSGGSVGGQPLPSSSTAGHAGSAAQATGQTQTAGTSVPAGSGQAGSVAQATTQAQGPDSLPFSSDDVQNVKEAIEDMRREREIAAAAAAVTADVAAEIEQGAAAPAGDKIRNFCPQCGAPLKQGLNFCSSCGAKIG
jgi:zinc-ribbon domain